MSIFKQYKKDLCSGTDRPVFSAIEKLSRDQRSDLKDMINNEVRLLAESDEQGDSGVDAYMLAAHTKRLITVDYQLLVEVTGLYSAEDISEYFASYGIDDQTPIMVTTYVRSNHIDEEEVPND